LLLKLYAFLKLTEPHITASTGSLIIPLSADITQDDIQDNQIYPIIISSLPQGVRYMAADSGYDDHKTIRFKHTQKRI
jgi:hypothetical protein